MFKRQLTLLFLLFAIVVSVSAEPNCVVELKFDENTGNTAFDSSGNGNNGTLVNFPVDDSQWVSGLVDGSLIFDGVNNYVDVNSPVSDDHSYSVAFYTKGPSWMGSTNNVYSEFNTIDGSRLIFRASWGVIQVYALNDAWSIVFNLTSTMWVYDDSWHHVALVVDEGSVDLYIDGVQDVNAAYSPGSVTYTSPTSSLIGAKQASPIDFFAGQIDDFKAYDGAIPEYQVAGLAADLPAEKWLEWSFESCDSSSIYDTSGNGYDGIISGSPACVEGQIGDARHFDGWDDTVVTPTNDANAMVSNEHVYSIAFWVKGPAQDSGHNLFKAWSSNGGYEFVCRGGGSMGGLVEIYGLNTSYDVVFDLFTGAVILDDKWHHLAFVDRAGEITVYVDGNVDQTASYSPDIYDRFHDNFSMASNTGLVGWFEGSFDEFTMYKGALSQEEIKAMVGAKGDYDGDGDVDESDLKTLASQWLLDNSGGITYTEDLQDDFESYVDTNALSGTWIPNPQETGDSNVLLCSSCGKNGSQALNWEYDNGSVTNLWSEILFIPDNPIDMSQYNELQFSLFRHSGNDQQAFMYTKYLNGGTTNSHIAAYHTSFGSTVDPVDQWDDVTLDLNNMDGWQGGYSDVSQLTDVRAIMFGCVKSGMPLGHGFIDIDNVILAVRPDCSANPVTTDLNEDCKNDFYDFAILAENWLGN